MSGTPPPEAPRNESREPQAEFGRSVREYFATLEARAEEGAIGRLAEDDDFGSWKEADVGV